MAPLAPSPAKSIFSDVTAGVVVFLVALPLCLGVALASGAPLFSGVLAGIIGGLVVGAISGSHTSVSGPAAGLTAIVVAQIAALGSFQTFLLAVFLAGLLQIGLGVMRAGFIAAFFPSSVIKGLLAAIGVILILKQIPHVLGHDLDPEGEMAFEQPDKQNTFSELIEVARNVDKLHPSAAIIGLASIAFLVLWDRSKSLKKSILPSALVVVLFGVIAHILFDRLGGRWTIETSHLVQMPVADSIKGFFNFFMLPNFGQILNPKVYQAAITIAIVASLETLLNLEAVDKIDPQRRDSPTSRELIAQGCGNAVAGLTGGIPVTSVIVRSSVNVLAGARTKLSTLVHGSLLLVSAMFLAQYLNMIPLSCLAAILLVTGFKLASPKLFKQMWKEGRYQFLPFIVTLVAIVLTDLLVGIMIGFVVALTFILNSNLRRPVKRVMEKHLGGEVLHIELANQVSFLNKASLAKILEEVPRGGHVLLDAQHTDYIDPDILSLIRDFKEQTAPIRGVQVSLSGFRDKYQLEDQVQYVDYSTRELQEQLTPVQVLQILREGNIRFRNNKRLTRDLGRQMSATAAGQHPLAVVLTCVDSRTPAEIVFDLGLGDVFVVRVAGNVTSRKILGSLEYGVAVAGAKLILVMGHTRCGAVGAAVDLMCSQKNAEETTGCQHLQQIIEEIQQSVDQNICRQADKLSAEEKEAFVNVVARNNVERSTQKIVEGSRTIRELVEAHKIAVVGALYDITSGRIDFLTGRADSHMAWDDSMAQRH